MPQLRFTSPVVRTRNVARIEAINISPTTRLIDIIVVFGDDTSGTFVEENRIIVHMGADAPLPAAVLTTITGLVTRAFTFLQARGIIPAGAEEA